MRRTGVFATGTERDHLKALTHTHEGRSPNWNLRSMHGEPEDGPQVVQHVQTLAKRYGLKGGPYKIQAGSGEFWEEKSDEKAVA